MKKLLSLFTITVCFHVFSQTIIFEEGFDNTPTGSLPLGWSTIDRDGDGSAWIVDQYNSYLTNSIGFTGGVAGALHNTITPDNLFISPAIIIPNNSSISLSFQIGVLAQGTLNSSVEHYAVYILPGSSTFQGNETPILEETIISPDIAVQKNVDISGFAGQAVKI